MFPPSSVSSGSSSAMSMSDQFSLSSAAQAAASRMYFNSQFFPQFGQLNGQPGMMGAAGHHNTNNSMQHSMNMLYMDSIQRQEHCSSGNYSSVKSSILNTCKHVICRPRAFLDEILGVKLSCEDCSQHVKLRYCRIWKIWIVMLVVAVNEFQLCCDLQTS